MLSSVMKVAMLERGAWAEDHTAGYGGERKESERRREGRRRGREREGGLNSAFITDPLSRTIFFNSCSLVT